MAVGKLDKLHVFRDVYTTPVGAGVRDYIHVVELAEKEPGGVWGRIEFVDNDDKGL